MDAESKRNMDQTIELISTSVDRTVALGRAIARVVRRGDVIALHGELGAGKTQWARGLAERIQSDICGHAGIHLEPSGFAY